ncbi:GNAT family N-acetyltransferase [Streptomyces marincola]|uniref:GNAT family N-acetyltransferase n=1 Tax=Streptomyces marincola TaxID=2878388 RepID=UPI00131C7BCB|nr:GNAT family N-acetyltransferase [Streptomyces marincola]
MTTTHYTREQLPQVRGTIVEVYSEVYADDIARDPFFSLERFEERLAAHTAAPGWACVVAATETDVAGFTYGFANGDGTTFKLCENMLRAPWRGRGISRVMHDALTRRREERVAQLLVRRERPRLRALYESWGYARTGEQVPFPDAPLYDVMTLPLR